MPRICLLLVLLTASACMSRASPETLEVRRQMDALRHENAEKQQMIRDLENRIFLLEDRLETAKVAASKTDQAPRLPVVTRRPASEAEPSAADGDREVIHISHANEDEQSGWDDPGASGDEQPIDPRPPKVIRIHGTAPGAPANASAYPDPAQVNEKLPIIAIPEAPRLDAPPPTAPAKPAAGGEPIATYQSAYGALGRRDHPAAIAGFNNFIQKWPGHDYADNAQYWLAEAHYDKGDFAVALTEFRRVVQRYPQGNKAPDALLKVGYCYVKLGELPAARDVLGQVVEIYPMTGAAKLAAKRLAEIGR